MRQAVDAPFDHVAQDYDAAFTETAVGRLQRAVVHRFLAQWKSNQDRQNLRVLELNCGTGEDAIWLARQGCFVLATDVSPEMVAITRAKADKAGLGEFIETQVVDIQDISQDLATFKKLSNLVLPSTVPELIRDLPPTGFDLIFSNFGGLNCVSPETLKNLGAALPELLNPGGHFIAVVMGRFCCWESLYFLLKGRFSTAFRRLSRKSVTANLDGKATMEIRYYGVREIMEYCSAGQFTNKIKTEIQAVGFWLPPSYLNPFFEKKPRLLRFLNKLEQKCRGKIWSHSADHFLICFKIQPPNHQHHNH